MKHSLLLLLLTCLCLLVIFTGCGTPAATTPPPSNPTPTPSNTTPNPENIPVAIEQTENDLEGKIVIDNVTVAAGTLDRDYFTPAAGQHSAGEPCFLVSVHIHNGYSEDGWVTFHADGLSDSGDQVSFTLDTGPQAGAWQVYLAADSSAEYTLHLSWSENVARLTVSSLRTIRTVP